jgi:hypothetical protein
MKNDPQRVNRDQQRKRLPRNYYRSIIKNDGTLDDLLENFHFVINRLLKVDPVEMIANWCRKQCGLPTSKELEDQCEGIGPNGYFCA